MLSIKLTLFSPTEFFLFFLSYTDFFLLNFETLNVERENRLSKLDMAGSEIIAVSLMADSNNLHQFWELDQQLWELDQNSRIWIN